MKKLLSACAVLVPLFLVGCNKEADPSSSPTAGANVKPYTLDTCVVSGEKLGSMGKPVEFDYQGQHIKLCCKNCKPDFEKEPAKYLGKLAAN